VRYETLIASPVAYAPDIETVADDEMLLIGKVCRPAPRLRRRDRVAAAGRPHSESLALLDGELRVHPGLPPELAQGLFAAPGDYRCVVRLSASCGLAVKALGVPGERLPGLDADRAQDFVFSNEGPAFRAADIRGMRSWARWLDGLRRAPAAAMPRHPLGEVYYSQAPLRYGAYVAKLCLKPASPEPQRPAAVTAGIGGDPLALRRLLIEHFAGQGAEWLLCAQLSTDREAMPVENAAVIWPEAQSPYRPVARLVCPPQPAWTDARSRQIDDGMTFSPWIGLEAHRPLGQIMRLHRTAHLLSAHRRGL